MERVWDELKKIEAQAEKIRNDAQNEAKTLTDLAQQESGKLIENSQAYAQEEAQQLYTSTIDQANFNYGEQLKANQQITKKLRAQAEKRMEKASSAIAKAVLGETKP
jgi:vacuolar-type H+-ATPase subunit E/Vma4